MVGYLELTTKPGLGLTKAMWWSGLLIIHPPALSAQAHRQGVLETARVVASQQQWMQTQISRAPLAAGSTQPLYGRVGLVTMQVKLVTIE